MSCCSSDQSNGLPSPPGTPAERPPNPYIVGASFTVARHQPPAPFGGSYSDYPVPYLESLPNPDQLEWCKLHPPAQGLTLSEDTRSITIIDAIRTGDSCGAQIVVTDTSLVAKIYDPLYYAFHVCGAPRKKIDVSTVADSDYSIEAAAYSEVFGHEVQGSIMPKYYGSWTLDITHWIQGAPVTREVRMILLEYVHGVRMLNLDPEDLTQEERENIMRKLVEADYDLRLAGVRHEDISPRNVILATTTSNFADPNMRLTLVDYGSSCVDRIYWGIHPLRRCHNPCFNWAGASMWSSWGWLPHNDDARIDWVWSIWGDGREGKYDKVERDPNSSLGRPKRPPVD